MLYFAWVDQRPRDKVHVHAVKHKSNLLKHSYNLAAFLHIGEFAWLIATDYDYD